jgi:hypothetical protein
MKWCQEELPNVLYIPEDGVDGQAVTIGPLKVLTSAGHTKTANIVLGMDVLC